MMTPPGSLLRLRLIFTSADTHNFVNTCLQLNKKLLESSAKGVVSGSPNVLKDYNTIGTIKAFLYHIRRILGSANVKTGIFTANSV